MKILIVHNKYSTYGGEDKIVEQQYHIFKQNGIDVKLYCKDNNNISNLSKIDKLKLIKEAYYSKTTGDELYELLEEFKPDIVHIHNIYPLISPIVYDLFYKMNIPVVQTLHNYRFICPNGLMFKNNSICEKCLKKDNYYECVYNKCFHNSYMQSFWYSNIINRSYHKGYFDKINRFIALNNFVKNKMIEKGYSKNKIEIIPNCIVKSNNDSIDYIKDNYYLYIGRLSSEKGIHTLIESFSSLKNMNLKIIGDGPLKDQIRRYIDKHELKNIEMLGFKTGKEKEKLIQCSKAVIVPSEWYENFPTVVLEAFSLGTLVIASDIGGLQYMIDDKYNGLKFSKGNINQLKGKLVLLNKDKDMIDQLSRNAYNTYIKNYSEDTYINNHIKLYENVIERY